MTIYYGSQFFMCSTKITLVNFELIFYAQLETYEQDYKNIGIKKLVPLHTHNTGASQTWSRTSYHIFINLCFIIYMTFAYNCLFFFLLKLQLHPFPLWIIATNLLLDSSQRYGNENRASVFADNCTHTQKPSPQHVTVD